MRVTGVWPGPAPSRPQLKDGDSTPALSSQEQGPPPSSGPGLRAIFSVSYALVFFHLWDKKGLF